MTPLNKPHKPPGGRVTPWHAFSTPRWPHEVAWSPHGSSLRLNRKKQKRWAKQNGWTSAKGEHNSILGHFRGTDVFYKQLAGGCKGTAQEKLMKTSWESQLRWLPNFRCMCTNFCKLIQWATLSCDVHIKQVLRISNEWNFKSMWKGLTTELTGNFWGTEHQ